jgi:hypothetical protein
VKTFGTTLILISLFLASCQEQSGPCEWYETKSIAEVVSVDAFDVNAEGDSLYRVGLQFDGTVYAEKIQYLEDLKEMEITSSTLAKNRIQVGIRYKTIVSELKSGNCKAPILSFETRIVP